jgi:hypothetical protein
MDEQLSKAEIRKDAMQEIIESGASTVAQIASIITTAVKDVVGAVGGFATDAFEIRDVVRRASTRVDDDAPDE